MVNDALNLLYDIPVDRIALRLLLKAPELSKLPNFEKVITAENAPRIRPEDITDVFQPPPWRANQSVYNQIPDHRLRKVGCYTILGFAHCCGPKIRSANSPSDRKRKVNWRGQPLKMRREHSWWVMEPDGTVAHNSWHTLRTLLPGESFNDAYLRRKQLKEERRNSNA